jgi:hypothetical protein
LATADMQRRRSLRTTQVKAATGAALARSHPFAALFQRLSATRAGASCAPHRESALRSGETSPEVQRWQRTSIDRAAPIAARVRCARRRSPGCSRLLAQPHEASMQCAAAFLLLSLRYALNASVGRSSRSPIDHYSVECGRTCRATSPSRGLTIPRPAGHIGSMTCLAMHVWERGHGPSRDRANAPEMLRRDPVHALTDQSCGLNARSSGPCARSQLRC